MTDLYHMDDPQFVPLPDGGHTPKLWAIFDMDGCLADDSHRRRLAEERRWDEYHGACSSDPRREAEVMLAKGFRLFREWHRVAVITGRPRRWEPETLAWLSRQGLSTVVDELYMRKDGDTRPSEVVKAEIIRDHFFDAGREIALAVEDRGKLVRMYRHMGIPVLRSFPLAQESRND